MQRDIDEVLGWPDQTAVHLDVILVQIGFAAELGYRGAIDRDAALEDQLLGVTPRGYARLRKDFLQSFGRPLTLLFAGQKKYLFCSIIGRD